MNDNWYKVDKWNFLKGFNHTRTLKKQLKDFEYSVMLTKDTGYRFHHIQYRATYDLYKNDECLIKGEFICDKLSQAKEIEHEIRTSLFKVFKRKEK